MCFLIVVVFHRSLMCFVANGDGKISFREFRDVMVNRNNEKRASLVIATAA